MMLHSPENLAGNCSDMTVLERRLARMKWQQLEERQGQGQHGGLSGSELAALFCMANADYKEMGFERFLMGGSGGGGGESVFGDVVNLENPVKPHPGLKNGWPDFSCFEMANSSFQGVLGPEMENCALSRTSSCAPQLMEAAVAAAVAVDSGEVCLGAKGKVDGSSAGRESFKKRKLEKMESTKEDNGEKRIRQSTEDEDSKITEQSNNNNKNNNNNNKNSKSRSTKNNNSSSRETSVCTSRENSKASEVQKTDYIHVRARRGQATDSHSLAERARREKIGERMKYLQDLVPGCNKITGKAGMLDEIINYVQSLQRQVEFLSMKLASINPRLDFSIGNLFCKEQMFPAYMANFPTASEISDAAFLQFNQAQQVPTCSGQEIGINPNAGRTVNNPDVPISSVFLDPSCLNQQGQPTLNWETSFPGIFNPEFHQGAATSFPSHQFTGSVDSHSKMEL